MEQLDATPVGLEPISNLSDKDFKDSKAYFDSIFKESKLNQSNYWLYKININKLETFQKLKLENEKTRKNVCFYCCFLMVSNHQNSFNFTDNNKIAAPVLSNLFRTNIEFSESEFIHIIFEITKFNKFRHHHIFEFPHAPFLSLIEKYKDKNGVSENLRDSINLLIRNRYDKDSLVLNARISQILNKSLENVSFSFHDYFIKKDMVGEYLSKYFTDDSAIKIEFLKLLADEFDKSLPTKKWTQKASDIINNFGKENATTFGIALMEVTTNLIKQLHKLDNLWTLHIEPNRQDYLKGNRWFFDKNEQILRGIVWIAPILNDPIYNEKVSELCIISYKKKAGLGPLLPKLGSSCIYGLSQLPEYLGISFLTLFNQKIKYANANKLIEKYLLEIAKKSGKTKDEIEEETISNYLLDEENKKTQVFGTCKAILSINKERKVEIKWFCEEKYQKSVPQIVKEKFPNELRLFQQQAKKITETLSIQTSKIEGFYLKNRRWTYSKWKVIYIQNGLLNTITKKLIWQFENDTQHESGVWLDGQFVDNKGQFIEWINENTTIQLWHPLGFEPNFVLQWREFLNEKQIIQPFKQAFREVYILTEAEIKTKNYSNRFAAHILKNYQFGTLCKLRNWEGYNQFYHGGIPELKLKNWEINVQYWVDFLNIENWGDLIATDQVKFLKNGKQMDLIDVPPIVFSESLRDIDLFVGVCSVGNDPTWGDGVNNFGHDYWQSYSFGDLGEMAKTRKSVLEKLIPRLKIAKIAEIKDKFLIIRGKLKTYKIHIGSGNILMEPNDQYLCIVPDRSSKTNKTDNVFLPFEGDSVLSIILSKAFLLADDDKITDPTITRQL